MPVTKTIISTVAVAALGAGIFESAQDGYDCMSPCLVTSEFSLPEQPHVPESDGPVLNDTRSQMGYETTMAPGVGY